jgi:hypothetical protein
MYTSWLLALLQVCGVAIPSVNWDNDYRTALKNAERAQRPLAVFIGSGKNGWQAISRGGDFDLEVRRLLSDHYICVYLDNSDPAGKKQAESFAVSQLPALVLSDRTRAYQAFRQAGVIDSAQLTQALRRYQAHEVVQPMVEAVAVRTNHYQPAGTPTWGGIICRT